MLKIILKSNRSSPDFFLIEGLASTRDRDSFDEVINQGGIDLALVEDGAVHLNLEHGDGFPLYELSVVGTVTEAEITDDGLWIRAKIFWAHPHAEKIYAEIEKSPKSVQLSVELADCEYGEGKFSDVVLTGTLIGVALTKDPANDATYAELAKSFHDPELVELMRDIERIKRTLGTIRTVPKKRKITVITGRR